MQPEYNQAHLEHWDEVPGHLEDVYYYLDASILIFHDSEALQTQLLCYVGSGTAVPFTSTQPQIGYCGVGIE